VSNSVAFKLIGAPGGTLIDPAGLVSAVHALHETYGDRLDWHDLQEAFEERAAIAEFEGNETRQAAELIAADAVRKIVEARRARKPE
jgi:NADH dehydrogenase/NADH:ubiquinone oxidoreductase subunit G